MSLGHYLNRKTLASVMVLALAGLSIIALSAQVSAVPAGSSFDHIVILAMENQDYSSVLGDGTPAGCPSGTAPFLCSMLPRSSTIPNYHSYGASVFSGDTVNSCSAGCYTAVTSGQDNSVDCSCVQSLSNTNIFDSLTSAGLSWIGYCDNNCPRQGDHFPCLQYSDTNNNPKCITVSDSLVGDTHVLDTFNSASPPNYIWLTPSDSENMHSVSISTGDNFVDSLFVGSGSLTIPASGSLLSTNLFTNPSFHTLLWIWWDEYDPSPNIEYGPMIKNTFISTSNGWDEYSTLKMIENNWGLPTLAKDVQAPLISDVFTTSPSSQPSSQPNSHTTGGGICITCDITPMLTTIPLLSVGLILGMMLSASVFLAKYHGRNRQLNAMMAQKQLESLSLKKHTHMVRHRRGYQSD